MSQEVRLGYYTTLLLCGLVMASQIREFFSASGGGLTAFQPLLFAFGMWICWSLYSGRRLGRQMLGLAVALNALNILFPDGHFRAIDSLTLHHAFGLPQPLALLADLLTIYLLFFFPPVQAYMRYIGGETL